MLTKLMFHLLFIFALVMIYIHFDLGTYFSEVFSWGSSAMSQVAHWFSMTSLSGAGGGSPWNAPIRPR